jgi:HD-GYP domain-containing protein (c-di-GMP phosphodiesterase class II)
VAASVASPPARRVGGRRRGDLEGWLLEVDAMFQVLHELSGNRRLPEVLDIALRKAEELCRAETSSIWELDPESQELSFRVVRGAAAVEIRDLRVAVGQGIVGSVAASGLAEVVNEVERDPRWQGDRTPGFTTRAILAVPLAVEGRVVGVLQLLNPIGKQGFDPRDLQRMQTFARLVAHAVENARLYEFQERQVVELATALAEAIDKRDPYTGGHIRRVVAYSVLLGRELELDRADLERLRLSATLHDVGKIAVPDDILRKPSPLTDEERRVMSLHATDGAQIVERISGFRDLVAGVRSHHERVDGKGYPDRLAGDEIPLFARIIAVADTYDAMTTSRPYRQALSAESAVAEIVRCSGSQFAPKVVVAFEALVQRGELQAERGQELVDDLTERRGR